MLVIIFKVKSLRLCAAQHFNVKVPLNWILMTGRVWIYWLWERSLLVCKLMRKWPVLPLISWTVSLSPTRSKSLNWWSQSEWTDVLSGVATSWHGRLLFKKCSLMDFSCPFLVFSWPDLGPELGCIQITCNLTWLCLILLLQVSDLCVKMSTESQLTHCHSGEKE